MEVSAEDNRRRTELLYLRPGISAAAGMAVAKEEASGLITDGKGAGQVPVVFEAAGGTTDVEPPKDDRDAAPTKGTNSTDENDANTNEGEAEDENINGFGVAEEEDEEDEGDEEDNVVRVAQAAAATKVADDEQQARAQALADAQVAHAQTLADEQAAHAQNFADDRSNQAAQAAALAVEQESRRDYQGRNSVN